MRNVDALVNSLDESRDARRLAPDALDLNIAYDVVEPDLVPLRRVLVRQALDIKCARV